MGATGVPPASGDFFVFWRRTALPSPQELANTIGMFGLYAAVTTFGVLSLKELYMTFGLHAHAFYIKPFLDFLIVAVTIVVVAIPEGAARNPQHSSTAALLLPQTCL